MEEEVEVVEVGWGLGISRTRMIGIEYSQCKQGSSKNKKARLQVKVVLKVK